jgi:hypothetical protein
MTLDPQQVAFFDTFGYLKFPGLLADCTAEIIDEFEAVWATRGGGHHGQVHDGQRRSCIVPFIDQRERLCSLLDDERITGIVTPFLGDDFNYMTSDGNYYAGDTPWHSDNWSTTSLRIKVALYLDPLTRETGALRVIPGSHRIGEPYAEHLHAEIRRSQEVWALPGADLPAVALETQPGDVVAFNQCIKHASFGGSARRRMFTLNFATRFPEERIQDLRDYCSIHTRFWIDRLYGETMIRTAGPDRMRHLEQVMANDSHMAALTREARQRMTEPSRG